MSKGVTPVVATVLLIAITVAAAGTMYGLIEENTRQAREQVEGANLNVNLDSLRVDQCYNQDSDGDGDEETHTVVRNNAVENAINASEITPLLNGSVQKNYGISPEIVNPQRTFTINFSKEFGPNTIIILTDGENQIDHSCYNL